MRNIIFASYGNDSIALIQWAHEHGLEDVTVAYSDTGWATSWWPARVEEAERWVRSLGFQSVTIVSEGMHNLVRRKKAWPRGGGGTFQFCTKALKEEPAVEWMESVDPDKEATCLIGVRREESSNRTTFPEHTEASPKHGGRDLWAPLVRHTEAMRDDLLSRTPFKPLPHRSKECWPCVNARKAELKLLEPAAIDRIEALEIEMGTNSKGNDRVMFSPARHNGASGIRAVVDDAQKGHDDLFGGMCDGGWCGS
jgi:3'-phosphoadenosine 5'-phosphosulfate sulfotransferase (PAPS reductase)/FAD synthetase